ncbi:hypothetical protein, partial [Tenacibaculum sp.]|uniref:hypothetical protein n=1 Tax=Tenacibaculum sp. TaxID=1906242 RepID=UPI003D0D5F86
MEKDMRLNQIQLDFLFDENQKSGYEYLLENGVYCNTCKTTCSKGIQVKEIYLNHLNDIVVHGTCNVCESKVIRTMEY